MDVVRRLRREVGRRVARRSRPRDRRSDAGGGQRASRVRCRSDPALLIGLAPFDDAAIYRLTDDVALVSTTDFFPPLVDDPADFGAIAAANACSDVFAMGGRVVLALNVAAFPEQLPARSGRRDLRRGGRGGGRGRWHGGRRPHDPLRGADLRARRAGRRAPRSRADQARGEARRRAGAVEADRHRASCSPAAATPTSGRPSPACAG